MDDQQIIPCTEHDLYISTEVIHTATLKYAAVLPSKDSACCPPLRRSGDKIYHTPLHPPPWRVHRSIQQNFKEAPALLGFESVGLVRWKNLGLFARPARPGGLSCGAGGSPRPGQRSMHVRRATRRGRRRGVWFVVVADMHGATHAARDGRVIFSLAGRAGRRRSALRSMLRVLMQCKVLENEWCRFSPLAYTVTATNDSSLPLVWTGLRRVLWSGKVHRSSDEWLLESCGSERCTIMVHGAG
jgi:hypothetical protein